MCVPSEHSNRQITETKYQKYPRQPECWDAHLRAKMGAKESEEQIREHHRARDHIGNV